MTAALPTTRAERRRVPLLSVTYGALALAGIVAAGAQGEARLLIPLTPGAAQALPALALDGRTRLIARGVLPGSLVVRTEDGASPPSLLRHGIVALAVPLQGCGA